MRNLQSATAAVVIGLALTSSAFAQYGAPSNGFQALRQPVWGPGGQPVLLNPNLNLLRGTDPAVNYFLGTQAEFQRRQNAYDFQFSIDDLNARERRLSEELPQRRGPVTSGTYSLVNNTGNYFNNTYSFFANGARPPVPTNRPGTYQPPQRPAGSPARFGMSPGFPPNPSFPTP